MTDEQHEQKETRIDELTESLARVQADYANYRRRTEEQRETERKRATRQLVSELLAVIDNLELALRQADEDQSLYQGVELVLAQLMTILEEHGVERIPEGDFDPGLHEAILTEPSSEAKGTIIETLQHGYRLGGQVLRTAKVKVSAGPTEKAQ